MSKMKAVIKPDQGYGLELTQVPVPAIGLNDVLIKVKAASICGSDLPVYEWNDPWVQTSVKPGTIIGHEFCGTIVEVGNGVSNLTIGDFVSAEGHVNCGRCSHCRSGEAHICPNLKLVGFERHGAFAEYIAVPAANVIRLAALPLAIGAILDPFGNAVHAVSKVKLSGLTVLVTGCGPLGLMTIALARFAGARFILATDVSDYRLKLAQEMGADSVLNVGTDDVGAAIVSETSAKSGFDVLFEMSGFAEALVQGFGQLRPGGQAVLMGLPKEPLEFDFANALIAKGITVHGVVGRLMYKTWEQALELLYTPRTYQALNLERIVTHRFMIEAYDEAFNLALSGQAGKVTFFFDEQTLQQSYSETLLKC